MQNLIYNPDFSSGTEHWKFSGSYSYDLTGQGLMGVIKDVNDVIFLAQDISLGKGSYFFRAELITESRFFVEVMSPAADLAVKAIMYENGSISSVEFNFQLEFDSKISIRISLMKALLGSQISVKYVCVHRDGVGSSPYLNAPSSKFWSSAVANRNYFDLDGLSNHAPILNHRYKYATAGSCFAQHISRHLKEKGLSCLDLEQSPTDLSKEELAIFGYGQFSCRYGNIYTTRQLYQLFLESEGRLCHGDDIWCKDGRFYDALRPSVDPVGYRRPEFVKAQRKVHLQQVSKMWRSFDVFVFTLGLTECWVSREFGSAYPTAPGTLAGCFDSNKYEFVNFSYDQIYSDLCSFWSEVKKINPNAKILLTVSPVPLTATATAEHVLVATMYSKSVLRAVAGDFVMTFPDAYYFPSYEIINSHPSRGFFYEPNLRSVNKAGVDFVMKHFFATNDFSVTDLSDKADSKDESVPEFQVYCDDELLDKFNSNV